VVYGSIALAHVQALRKVSITITRYVRVSLHLCGVADGIQGCDYRLAGRSIR